MTYIWYLIFNELEFDAFNIPSKNYRVNIDGMGQVDVLATRGLTLGITHDGVFLSLNLNDKSPFLFEGLGIYRDDNSNIYLGFLDES